jgi:hypothetical protein
MGMSIDIVRLTVCSPSGVTHAQRGGEFSIRGPDTVDQVNHFSRTLLDIDAPILDQRNARRIVAAVFQPPQSFKNDGDAISRTNISDYAAHKSIHHSKLVKKIAITLLKINESNRDDLR